MDYPLEQLDPERFQHLCQSLIAAEFPAMQAFPVGQADGGRDAIVHHLDSERRSYVMFQVKFVRDPGSITSPARWLIDTMRGEVPKVRSYARKGVQQYVLVTNVRGTAFPERGSMDKIGDVLAGIGVSHMCWWRDDLNRRLDNSWNLKWVFPELMTGPDLLRAIIEPGLAEERDRRMSALTAFVTDQYNRDREVKFKQVELQNRLLDLFIDVPIVAPTHTGSRRIHHRAKAIHNYVVRHAARDGAPSDASRNDTGAWHYVVEWNGTVSREDRDQVGAARFLLDSTTQQSFPLIVLEGAPGQGKSTITQYVCQVHRMRLLAKALDLASLPETHATGTVRLPFRIDLRDFATWLSKRNPFSVDAADDMPANWHRSLESFLSVLVQHHSGGAAFDVSDLHAVLRVSAILIVFDGLDEIADIAKRKEIVEEIEKGIDRLVSIAVSVQAIVTSRPAAFANSPGLSHERFPYFELGSVTRPLIDEYAEKWIRARRVDGRDGADVRRILRDKLDQPHMRDLARNPMQLAILLSLIHTRGSSLPDKRTALYDSYVDLFFNREAEKSAVVRDYRDQLISIHRYLAWMLHAESELGNTTGSIAQAKLHSVLKEYLEREGHDPGLAGVLFQGMVERVVALVSRVEGTYEFEVQPLREYFAARFLYETAPYSPPGAEKRGTKPDRFDAIARNFYWLNVARFYAGCFSKGELASLIDRLQELAKEDGYRQISHPRVLAATLLADWVFTQHPRSVRQVVRLILDGIGLRFVLVSNSRRIGIGTTPLVLPRQCGREELVDFCFSLLEQQPPDDCALDVIDLLDANASYEELLARWSAVTQNLDAQRRGSWLRWGVPLGLLPRMPIEALNSFEEDIAGSNEVLNAVFQARRQDYFESSASRFAGVVRAIADCQIEFTSHRRPRSIAESLLQALMPARYSAAFSATGPIPLKQIWQHHRRYAELLSEDRHDPPFRDCGLWNRCAEFVQCADELADLPADSWRTPEPWSRLVEQARTSVGDCWSATLLAVSAAGIPRVEPLPADASEIANDAVDLCLRARYARMRAGNVRWWLRQLETSCDPSVTNFLLLSAALWASGQTLIEIAAPLDELIGNLDPGRWRSLHSCVVNAMAVTNDMVRVRPAELDARRVRQPLHARATLLLSYRAPAAVRAMLLRRLIGEYRGSELEILEILQREALRRIFDASRVNKEALAFVSMAYKRGVVSEPFAFHSFTRRNVPQGMPRQTADVITASPDDYPGFLVAAAEQRIRESVAQRIVPVGKIAEEEGWFDDAPQLRAGGPIGVG